MAKMIPSQISPEVKSNAERKIFRWFSEAPETKDWIVLHSLGISNHTTVMYGEIDFFVIAPGLGIFALEAKGGRVGRVNGQWSFINRYGQISYKKRGPFEQAQDGIQSLMASLRKKCTDDRSDLANVLFGFGVMFPDITYKADGTDGEQWQVFDENDGGNIADFVRRVARHTQEKWIRLYGSVAGKLPTKEQANTIAEWLRGDFEVAVSFYTQIRYSETELIRLTKRQLMCLRQLEEEPRCLFEGGAGTGKTLLALEAAKQKAASGKNVALICFNSLLGKSFNIYYEALPPELRPQFVGALHSLMLQTARKQFPTIKPPDDERLQPDFYHLYLPEATLPTITDDLQFDSIIIDEAQDVICDTYLDIIDAYLKGGLSDGEWIMCGDFNNQAIFTEYGDPAKQKGALKARSHYTTCKLFENCRNTKQIGTEIHRVTGFDSIEYLQQDVEGLPVNHITYQGVSDQKEKVERLLEDLLSQKIPMDQIVLLSPRKWDNSVVSKISKYPVLAYEAGRKQRLTFSTIHAFKGLESSVVIILDINSYRNERLMYVGLSRPRNMLCVFETENAQKEYAALWGRCPK